MKNDKNWECLVCGMTRSKPGEKPGKGQIPPSAIHLTVGSIVNGWKVRPEREGDRCRGWSSVIAYRQYLNTRSDHENDYRDLA